jgi:hypothetical protein
MAHISHKSINGQTLQTLADFFSFFKYILFVKICARGVFQDRVRPYDGANFSCSSDTNREII